jgi:NADPH-dependent 2,4-dienoyl-CoA reductase/sulfur reductase-like enzyme
MPERVVVIGADAAGMSAAHQALREGRRRGRAVDVVVVERTQDTSYSACGLPYWVAGDVADDATLVARTAEQHRAAGIDLRMATVATAIDLDQRVVTVRPAADSGLAGPAQDGTETDLGFDSLVLATGARPKTPPWALTSDGSWVPGVRAVKTLDDGRAWLSLLDGQGSGAVRTNRAIRKAVVVGGGYIGIEMAEAFVRRGLSTTLVTIREVMGTLEPELGRLIHAGLEAAGVEVVCSGKADGLDVGDDGWVTGVRAGSRVIPGDVVALGLGAEPATELAAAAGLPLGAAGGLLPDPRQEVAPGVWGAGDCCESIARIGGYRIFVPLGTHANKQGRVAGTNLAGGNAVFEGVLGTAITRFVAGGQHIEIARTGPTLAQAQDADTGLGAEVVSLLTQSTTASGYMPQAHPIAVLVLADRATRRLLGVQLVGGPGTGKRIDTAASALWCQASVDDVAAMDLSYAPPFSPVWDPVQIACRRMADSLGR